MGYICHSRYGHSISYLTQRIYCLFIFLTLSPLVPSLMLSHILRPLIIAISYMYFSFISLAVKNSQYLVNIRD